EALDPGGEVGVQPTPPRLGQARVRHLARQRMLEAELALTRQHRAGPPADEVALFEDPPVDVGAPGQLRDGPGPDDPADHGSCLESYLGRGAEQVHPGGQDGLYGVR